MAATSMNWEGKVIVPAAREIVTRPSSSGWRIVSRTLRLNSGSSSRNRTPWCASEISPGVGLTFPPSSPASLAVGRDAFLSPKAGGNQAQERQLLMEIRAVSSPSATYRRGDQEAPFRLENDSRQMPKDSGRGQEHPGQLGRGPT